MTLVAYLAGSDKAHKIKVGEMGLSSSADGGGAFGQIIFDDPDGNMNVRAFMHVRVEETDCTDAPVLHWGWIWVRTYRRGPYRDGPGRVIDCQVLDPNYILNHQIITGLDGKRDAETDIERADWILGSPYLNGLISDFGLIDRSAPHPMEEANYIGQHPSEVLQDLTGQLWKTWFAYVDQDEDAIGLFYDTPPSTAGTSTLTISNVLSDTRDGGGDSTCYPPFTDAELTRDPSEVYSKMRFKFRNGVVLGQNDDTYAEFFADTGLGQRGVQVESIRVGLETTARARVQTLLERASQEAEDITFTIEIIPEDVGLIQAGQRLGQRWTHLPGFDPLAYSRVTSRTIRQVRSDLYRMDIECSMAGVTAGAGGGGGDPDTFPHPPPGRPNLVQHVPGVAGFHLDTVPADGNLMLVWATSRLAVPPPAAGWDIVADVAFPFTGGGIGSGQYGRLFSRIASGETLLTGVLQGNGEGDAGSYSEWSAGTSIDDFVFANLASETPDPVLNSGGLITPSRDGIVVGFAVVGGFFGVVVTEDPSVTVLDEDFRSSPPDAPRSWSGYKDGHAGVPTTITGTLTGEQLSSGVTVVLVSAASADPPSPGQWHGIDPKEIVTMTGPDGTTLFPFADGSLSVFVDDLNQTAKLIAQDGATGEFTLGFTPTPTEVVTVRYQGR